MSRPLDIPLALKYPWQHAGKMLVIPGVLFLGYFMFYLVGLFAGILLSGVDLNNPHSADSLSTNPAYVGTVMAISMVSIFLFLSPIFGFTWELAETLRKDGYDAPPPPWGGNF